MKDKVKETLDGLKDFQLKTVEYVYDQLYKKRRNKMLIADEVGLGKTIVAKGIIAKAYEAFRPSDEKPVMNVVYVCSNQALAKQNLAKLNFTGDPRAVEHSDDDDRLTGLSYVTKEVDIPFAFRIKAFTPATSFDDNTRAGKADERVLLYRLLYDYADLGDDRNSLKWILKGNKRISDETWEHKINLAEQCDAGRSDALRKIRPAVYSMFRDALKEEKTPEELRKCFDAAGFKSPVKYWTLIKKLCGLGVRKNNYYNYDFQRELISSLRFLLSQVCIEFLKADIFILDEFQRYKRLIAGDAEGEDSDDSEAMQIAQQIMSFSNSKILMLSATPFKPYTNEFDELNGEVHYNEFKTVLQFLIPGKPKVYWDEYEADRRSFYNFLRHPEKLHEGIGPAMEIKNKLESLYRSGMVRTEKVLASSDHNAMIQHMDPGSIDIHPEDIHDFVALDQITQTLNANHHASLPVPLEYVKSSPYALSFLDNYQHKEKIRKLANVDPELKKLLRKTRHAWINLEKIQEYKPLIPERGRMLPNAKLRMLLEQTVHGQGWKLLWIPPSIPYYELQGAFQECWGFSKTLIFSSWKMVPRMVSSLVSYEAERLSVGNSDSISEREKAEEKREYFQKRRTPRPQFTFKVDKEAQEPTQMNNFSLTYPSVYLASVYDPAVNVQEKRSLTDIRVELKARILRQAKKKKFQEVGDEKGDWIKWLWVGPLLLDQDDADITQWFEKGMPPSELAIDSEGTAYDRDEHSGKASHYDHAREVFLKRHAQGLPKLSDDQLDKAADHFVDLALGSPAICSLRTFWRHNGKSVEALDAAFNVSSAFLTLFNKPESIAIVRLTTPAGDFWKRMLQYTINGNIQAMLDEFIYLLAKGENIQTTAALSDFISDILAVRTSGTDVDDLDLFIDNLSLEQKKRRIIRTHYAADFGNQKVGSASSANRQINIRQAFNSPFRPFVLASTSIGQEGLDFHLYCRKIIHWNLPSNPIDFEQREGRIHRYMGLVIRLNLAEKYRNEIKLRDESQDVWSELIQIASKEKNTAPFKSDLVPFWHTDPKGDIKIERFVPLYPFSSDVQKFNNLIKILTFYRFTFGQPRQEELIESLHGENFDEQMMARLNELVINLSPIRFWKG